MLITSEGRQEVAVGCDEGLDDTEGSSETVGICDGDADTEGFTEMVGFDDGDADSDGATEKVPQSSSIWNWT